MENQKLKSQIEAILFLTDKPMKAGAIARIVNQDLQVTRRALLDLIHEYEERIGGLEIADDDDGYIIQVRSEYAFIIDEFAPMDMSVALLRTLSAIAIKQPVPQSEIVKIRGAGAYDHIKDLLERELVIKKEEGGRSPTLSTTKKFQEYFRLTQDAKVLRNELTKERKPEVDGAQSAEGPEGSENSKNSEGPDSSVPVLSSEFISDDATNNVLNFSPDETLGALLLQSDGSEQAAGEDTTEKQVSTAINEVSTAVNETRVNTDTESFEPPLVAPIAEHMFEQNTISGDNLS